MINESGGKIVYSKKKNRAKLEIELLKENKKTYSDFRHAHQVVKERLKYYYQVYCNDNLGNNYRQMVGT